VKDFEREIITELLRASELKYYSIYNEVDVSIEYSGVGYFLTVKDPMLPTHRIVLNDPTVTGKLGGIDVGFLAFVENSKLLLECYAYDEDILPKHREKGFVRDAT